MKFPNIEAERIKRELDKDQFSRTLGVTRRTRLPSGADHGAGGRGQAGVGCAEGNMWRGGEEHGRRQAENL